MDVTGGSLEEYWPSSIAAAAILCAASELPTLSFVTPEHAESWCDGLCKVSTFTYIFLIANYFTYTVFTQLNHQPHIFNTVYMRNVEDRCYICTFKPQ